MSDVIVEGVAGNLIGGAWSQGRTEELSTNPAAPNDVIIRFGPATPADVDLAVAAAETARRDWAALSPLERGMVLRRAADEVGTRKEELAVLLTREEGKPLAEARGEIGRTEQILLYHAGQAWCPAGSIYAAASAGEEVRTLRFPVGVVAVITPFNFPMAIPAWKIAPALVYGNTVVWKAAEQTPAVAIEFARILERAGLPDGVLNLVLGGGDVGAALVGHPGVHAITFTGSEGVGAAILMRATKRGARVQLELGGHNPAVVLADADLDNAAAHIVQGAMGASGQKCTSTRRAIVDASVRDQLVELVEARIANLRIGAGLEAEVEIGPLVSERAAEQFRDAIREAEVAGAVVRSPVAESMLPSDGYFVPPTLVIADDPTLRIAQEEVFGPVLCVLTASGDDEALMLANGTRFGLAAAVFTTCEARARRFVGELQAGVIHVNNATTGSEPHVPFGGVSAASAYGPPEQGEAAREFFTITKTAYVNLMSAREKMRDHAERV